MLHCTLLSKSQYSQCFVILLKELLVPLFELSHLELFSVHIYLFFLWSLCLKSFIVFFPENTNLGKKKLFNFLKQFSLLGIRKMVSHHNNKDLLKIRSFYSSEIILPSSSKKLPMLIYLKSFHFFHKEERNLKDWLNTKY